MSARTKIVAVSARQIVDSRGAPTVEATVSLEGGARASASVPSGASTGTHEARELRDGGSTWAGRGVLQAVRNVETALAAGLMGRDASDQRDLDARIREIDGTSDFSRLGANAALAVSLAATRAAALAADLPFYAHLARLTGAEPCLPLPMVNMISGGAHAGGNVAIQDVLAIPLAATSYREALEVLVRLYWTVRATVVERGHPPLVGDEGGFGPRLPSSETAIELVVAAIERAGLHPGSDVALALDVAATQFADGERYRFEGRERDAAEMIAIVAGWIDAFPIVSIEDPLAEDDWNGWRMLTERLGRRVQIVGDDLFTTNVTRIRRGIDGGVANAVLIKANQIGTLSLAIDALALARENGYRTIVSARSGETEDDWLADWAVGSGAGQIKVGSVARSERLAKYNRLLRIEETLPRYRSGRDLFAVHSSPSK